LLPFIEGYKTKDPVNSGKVLLIHMNFLVNRRGIQVVNYERKYELEI
jgi:hypothetical protein